MKQYYIVSLSLFQCPELCISCFKLHKNKLEENRAWMEQGTAEEDKALSKVGVVI